MGAVIHLATENGPESTANSPLVGVTVSESSPQIQHSKLQESNEKDLFNSN